MTVIVTAYGSISSAVEALKAGADDYLEKPLVPEKLLHVLHRTFEEKRLKHEIDSLRLNLTQQYHFANIIGKHPKMQQIFHLIKSVANLDCTVLIQGETGTGKDLVAKAIHFQSRRAHQPFVAINCASVPENLLESELFGFERGAFTGAYRRKKGKLEEAQGGTVFLDEIGDMPMSIQGKLLRAIQEKKIERLGGSQSLSLNIRIISATNKDLSLAIVQNLFRLDLYYRINVVPIHIPPLRERREDIPLLLDHFLDKLARQNGKSRPRISEEAFGSLMTYSWPGNVRELENTLERTMIYNTSGDIEHVQFSPVKTPSKTLGIDTALRTDMSLPLKTIRDQAAAMAERGYLSGLLSRYNGSIKRTAAHADIDVRTVRRKMRDLGLDKYDFK